MGHGLQVQHRGFSQVFPRAQNSHIQQDHVPALLLDVEVASLNCLFSPSPLLERYRTFFRPKYKIGYKTVTELSWRCCPGFMGEGCHDSPTDQPGLLPQHPSPKMPPGQKMFPMPRLPPYPKSHPDLFPGPKKNQYGEILLLLHVSGSPHHCHALKPSGSLCSSAEHEQGKNSVGDRFSVRDLTFDCFETHLLFVSCFFQNIQLQNCLSLLI